MEIRRPVRKPVHAEGQLVARDRSMKGFSVLGFGGSNGRRRSLGKMHVYDKCVFVREFTNRSN